MMAADIYSDVNVDGSSERPLTTGIDAVFQSLDSLFSTERDERPFLLDYTADLESFLFEPLNPTVALQMYAALAGALERFEPRVLLSESESRVEVNDQENGYDITLSMIIRGYEDETVVYRAFAPRIF